MVFEYILNQNHIDPATDLTIDQNIDFGSTAAAFAEDKSDYDFTVEFEPGATNLENRVRDTLSPLLERTAAMFRTLLSLQRRVTSTNIRKSSRDSPMHCKRYGLRGIPHTGRHCPGNRSSVQRDHTGYDHNHHFPLL